MAEALQERVIALEAELRDERRQRVKLEKSLKSQQDERASLAEELKLERKATHRHVTEVKNCQLEKNKLLSAVDQLNKKLEAASTELIRLRTELKLKDTIGGNIEPRPPPQPPTHRQRKNKTRSAPSHAMGVLDAEKGAAARVEELETLLEVAQNKIDKSERQLSAEKKKRGAAKRDLNELATAAAGGCRQSQWALQWVKQGVTAVDSWLGGLRVKDTNDGVWNQGLASTRTTIQYMKMVLSNGAEGMEALQASADHARSLCGQAVVSGAELQPPNVTRQDGSEEKMQVLISEAKQMMAQQKEQAAVHSVPSLRLAAAAKAQTPREAGYSYSRGAAGVGGGVVDDDRSEATGRTTSRTVPGPANHVRDKEGREGKGKRGVLPPPVSEGGYAVPKRDATVVQGSADSKVQDSKPQDGVYTRRSVNVLQGGAPVKAPTKGVDATQQDSGPESQRTMADKAIRGAGAGYAARHAARQRLMVHQRN